MKKTFYAAIAVALSITSFVTTPAQADTKSLVIIDSYFDSRVLGATIVCVASTNCNTIVKPTTSVSDNVNHGDAMAEVAKKQNPNISLILLRATSSAQDVNGVDLIRALQWVDKNSNLVGAVSFSRSISNNANGGNCQLASAGLAVGGLTVSKADAQIQSLILSLKGKGIPFFASTGNKNAVSTSVTYPACLPITNSVTANNYIPALSNSDTDYIGSLPANVYSYSGTIKFNSNTLIPQTTSSATVAVAAKYLSNILDNKLVSVLP